MANETPLQREKGIAMWGMVLLVGGTLLTGLALAGRFIVLIKLVDILDPGSKKKGV